eukprot:3059521-Pleurochrysis_carterae.AAC.2
MMHYAILVSRKYILKSQSHPRCDGVGCVGHRMPASPSTSWGCACASSLCTSNRQIAHRLRVI